MDSLLSDITPSLIQNFNPLSLYILETFGDYNLLTVNGELIINGMAVFNQDITCMGNLNIGQNITIDGTLQIQGNIELFGDFQQIGNYYLNGNMEIYQNLLVDENAIIQKDLFVQDNIYIQDNLYVLKNANISNNLNVSNNLYVDNNIYIQGINLPEYIADISNVHWVQNPDLTLYYNLGNVGIGTSNPQQKLDVNGTIKGNYLQGILTTSSQPNITSVGNLTNLNVNGNIISSNLYSDNIYTNNIVSLNNSAINFLNEIYIETPFESRFQNSNTYIYVNSYSNILENNYYGRLGAYDVNLGSLDLCINEYGGNIGIGTTSPNSKLSISPLITESKITLWDGGDLSNHYGFGVSSYELNYHIGTNLASHVFHANGKNGNGTELMRITGTGKVGINNNNPLNTLDVVGTIGTTNKLDVGNPFLTNGYLSIYPDGNNVTIESMQGNNYLIKRDIWFNTYGGNSIFYENVGIGTTNPTNKLNIESITSSYSNLNNFLSASTLPAQISASSENGDQRLYLGSYYNPGVSQSSVIQSSSFYSGIDHGEVLYINPKGGQVNVGNILSYSGDSLSVQNTFNVNNSNVSLRLTNYLNNNYIESGNLNQNGSTANLLFTGMGGFPELMIICNNGNVGIGTSTPNSTLDVNGGINVNEVGINFYHKSGLLNEKNAYINHFNSQVNHFFSDDTNGGTNAYLIVEQIGYEPSNILFLNSTNIERMRICNNGNVGIGTSNPQAKLHINGSLLLPALSYSSPISNYDYYNQNLDFIFNNIIFQTVPVNYSRIGNTINITISTMSGLLPGSANYITAMIPYPFYPSSFSSDVITLVQLTYNVGVPTNDVAVVKLSNIGKISIGEEISFQQFNRFGQENITLPYFTITFNV